MRIFSGGRTMKALSAVFGTTLLLTTAMDSARPMLNIVVGPA